jgi:hypothetical protein
MRIAFQASMANFEDGDFALVRCLWYGCGRNMNSRILAKPPQPGWLRVCPRCRRWFALCLAQRHDPPEGRLRVFRCRYCGEETRFADRHPSGAV